MHRMSTAVVPFWERLGRHSRRTAIVADRPDGRRVSYEELATLIARAADRLRAIPRTLICTTLNADVQTIACYLAALVAGHAVLLCRADADAQHALRLVDRYRPGVILGAMGTSIVRARPQARWWCGELLSCAMVRPRTSEIPLHPRLSLLLATSGSTAAARFARLSKENVAVSAIQAAQAMEVGPHDRVMVCLPLNHVYGLSVVHAALAVGATLVLGSRTVLDREFWRTVATERVTAMPAVPTQLRLMRQSAIDPGKFPDLARLTISGSALDGATREWLVDIVGRGGVRVHSMYGMTEACGRISVLPPEEFAVRSTSVGRAVSGGRLDVSPEGEVLYGGPNVALGYALDATDLAKNDELRGTLRTGDLGRFDPDGNLHLTGRLSRLCKVLDTRLNLDDLEARLAACGEIAVTADDESIAVFCGPTADEACVRAQVGEIAALHRIPHSVFSIRTNANIPRTPTGKKSYSELRMTRAAT